MASVPMTYMRSGEWPIRTATFRPGFMPSTAFRYSGNEVQFHGTPFSRVSKSRPSTREKICISGSRCSGLHGAKARPQLPMTKLVTPCQHDEVSSGSQKTWAS